MNVITEARNSTFAEALALIEAQNEVKYDVVANAAALRYQDGKLHLVDGGEPELTPDGVSLRDLVLDPTDGFGSDIAARLNIPRAYFRTMEGTNVPLLDANVNGWLGHSSNAGRKFMVRTFRDGNGGIARSLHSSSYSIVDNLAFIRATGEGIARSGHEYEVTGVNLSADFFRFDVLAPQVSVLAPALLDGYVSPFDRTRTGNAIPIVRAGVRCSNSETGRGMTKVEPWIRFEVCSNGMTLTKFAEDLTMRQVHRGARHDVGVVTLSQDTLAAQLKALTGKVADSMASFLDEKWLQEQVDLMTAKAGKSVPASQALPTITRVAGALHLTGTERDAILDIFMGSGQMTAGGVMQAMTAHAQQVASPDRAAHLEGNALEALALV